MLLSLSQLLAVTEEWSHLGLCGTGHVCHCGEDLAGIWHLRLFPTVSVMSLSNPLTNLQVNIGILISVTRIISRIGGESYKVHGDTNTVKWVCYPSAPSFVKSEKCKCASVLICVKVDGKGGGGPPAHTRHFLDLWHPCSQHTIFGVPVYFCYIQLITSRSLCARKVVCKIKRV